MTDIYPVEPGFAAQARTNAADHAQAYAASVSGDDAFQAGTGRQVIAEARQMIVDRPVDWTHAKPTALEAVRRAAVDALSRMVRTHTD